MKRVLSRMTTLVKLMAVFIMHFPAMKLPALLNRVFAARRCRTVISVTIVEGVVYMAMKAMRAVEPWPGADKDSAREPLGTIVAIRRAFVWRVVEVAVRALRRGSDLNCNLSLGLLWPSCKEECRTCKQK